MSDDKRTTKPTPATPADTGPQPEPPAKKADPIRALRRLANLLEPYSPAQRKQILQFALQMVEE